MNHSQLPEMSKRPRLIVRIGGMGNRVFGTDGSWKINENPAELQAAAKLACGEVLSQVELALSEIWRDEQLVHYPCDKHGPNRFITHWLSLVFGSRNRWNRNCPEFWHSVFQDVPPEVQVLTGHEIGSDQLIESVAAERSKHNEGQVAYSFKYIKPGSRDQTSDDGCELLSIGVAPEKPPVIKETIDSKQPISRQDAAQWSRVTRQRALAFRAQSDALRHHSDLLLAIWDPHAEAKPGGTAESVEIALRERIPVVAILVQGTTTAAEIHVLNTLDDLRKLRSHSPGVPGSGWKDQLNKLLRGLLAFPDTPHSASCTGRAEKDAQEATHEKSHDRSAYHPRAAFEAVVSADSLRTIWLGRWWQAFDAYTKYRGAVAKLKQERPDGCERREAIKKAWAQCRTVCSVRALIWPKKSDPKPAQGTGIYQNHYDKVKARVDSRGLSGVFGDAHRGGFLLSYVLALVAVLCALVGGLTHFLKGPHWALIALGIGELAAIVAMYALSVCSKAEGWNLAYTHSRILGEALRMMQFLGPLGLRTPIPRLPHYLHNHPRTPLPNELWVIWYFRALVRMAPLRLMENNVPTLKESRDIIVKMVDKQIEYHQGVVWKQQTLHHDLERWANWLFLLVFVAAAGHVAELVLDLHSKIVLCSCLIICVIGPAMIAAIHGFASQMEVSRLQQRSSSMVRVLEEQKRRLVELPLDDETTAESVWGLSVEALHTASLMMDESASWSLIYTNKDIHAG